MTRKMYKRLLAIILFVFFLFIMSYFLLDFHYDFLNPFNFAKNSVKTKNIKYQYGVIVDAGSSGSRLFIYKWPPHNGNAAELLQLKPLLDKYGKPVVKKVNPGLSSLADNPAKAQAYIKPLMDLAFSSIPKSQHIETPFYLMATAGMRMISSEAQAAILENIRRFVRTEYEFLFSDSHVKVITGQEEGIYGWITTNYLLGRFNHNHSDGIAIVPVHYGDSNFRSKQVHHRKRTVGILDMGGGSMQIAYELEPNVAKHWDSAVTFNLGCRENDADHTYRVFVTTFLGFGANSARTRYERMLVKDHVAFQNDTRALNGTQEPLKVAIEDPCLHKGSEITQSIRVTNDSQGGLSLSSKQINKMPSIKVTFVGTGKYHQCESSLLSLLNKQPCPSAPQTGLMTCTMSGRLHPSMDLASTQFYGFSEFWYSTQDVLGLGGHYNYFKLHSEAVEHCSKNWVTLTFDYKKGLFKNADWPRMRYQCFKSAWITNILHHGLGFPNAFNKFISVQEINGAEVQWSLGALLFQTRYFPLRVIEQKEQNLKKQTRETQNKSKSIFVYLFLFLAVLLVMATVYWMHNRQQLKYLWSLNPYQRNFYKTGSSFDRHSPDSPFDTVPLAHKYGPMKDFRSSPNLKFWT